MTPYFSKEQMEYLEDLFLRRLEQMRTLPDCGEVRKEIEDINGVLLAIKVAKEGQDF